MNRKCPRCGSLCPIYAREVGRTQDCWDCGARLVLQEDGLHLVEDNEDEPERSPRGKSRSALTTPSAAADPFIWLFAAGAIVVLLCQTLPMIQKASISSIDARLLAGDLDIKKVRRDLDDRYDQKREPIREKERKLQARRDALTEKKRKAGINPDRAPFPPFGGDKVENPFAKEEEAIAKEANDIQAERDKVEAELKSTYRDEEDALARQQTDWNKKRSRIDLEERSEAEISALGRSQWYSWATLAGLLLLTAGSLGFLGSRQPTGRRVLGIIVLAGLVLFLISKAAGGRSLFATLLPDPLGKGLAAYDLSTPRAALIAENEMRLNRDIRAEIDSRLDDDLAREHIQSLVVHREVDAGNDQRVLFITWRENGVTKYRTPVLELVPKLGIWRDSGSGEYALKERNEALGKQMRDWERQGAPNRRFPDDL